MLLVLGAVLVGVGLARHTAARPPGRRLTDPDTLLLAWLGGTLVILLVEHPLWRPHVSEVIPALAILAARHRPPTRLLAVALVVALPYHLVHVWDILHPAPYRGEEAAHRRHPRGAA